MKVISAVMISILLFSATGQAEFKGSNTPKRSEGSKSVAPKPAKAPAKTAAPKRPSKAAEQESGSPLPGPAPVYDLEPGRPRPTPVAFTPSKGRWRLRAGGFLGWWWGDLRDKERSYADGIMVDLGGGDFERLKLLHTVVGPFASASWSIRPWLSAGLRTHMIFVTQAADLPEDVERVSAGVWRTGGVQSTITFYAPTRKRIQPFLEFAYGPAWGSWSPHAAANEMPPRQRQESFGASGELWGLGLGWEYFQSSRGGWLVDFRWNVGDFTVENIPEAQYNGHFTIGVAAVFRP